MSEFLNLVSHLKKINPRARIAAIAGAGLVLGLATYRAVRPVEPPGATPHRVYVALGFHTNLYHSYRVDTPDEAGFGADIRVIRHILNVLKDRRQNGKPIPAVWNFDNLFSLGHALPRHAPEIVDEVRRRIREQGDEVILMSYNNGMLSAMRPNEFRDSMNRAITNREGNGVRDVFGAYSPIVRPQEMMVTPGNYGLYRELGIDTIALFYSSVAFDAFRVFTRPLSLEEAHNPLRYLDKATGESIRVIPTYNIGDLVEHVSLRHWARDLHRRQRAGEINRDVLVYINTDADSPYWNGVALPGPLGAVPNTGGLTQLLDGVADLEFVEFTTLSEYLKSRTGNRDPTIYFSQDLADGNFNGYHSWAEKESSHRYWTALERDRRNHDFATAIFTAARQAVPERIRERLAASYEKRLRLLSTTNFGLAMPFLARGREQHVEDTIRQMLEASEEARRQSARFARSRFMNEQAGRDTDQGDLGAFYLFAGDGKGPRFAHLNVPAGSRAAELAPGTRLELVGPEGTDSSIVFDKRELANSEFTLRLLLHDRRGPAHRVTAGRTGRARLRLAARQPTPMPGTGQTPPETVRMDALSVRLDAGERIRAIELNGREFLAADSLTPAIRYRGEFVRPRLSARITEHNADFVRLRLRGEFALPGNHRPGFVDTRLSLVRGVPYIFVESAVQYPDTPRTAILSENQPALARRFDPGWEETLPAPLNFAAPASAERPFRIFKRNYLGLENSYAVDYFRHSPANRSLANLNNHLTPEFVALGAPDRGLAVAADSTELANFAFAPMKMRSDENGTLRMSVNPFGTFHGEAWEQPTQGDGLGNRIALATGPQYATPAPTYNGRGISFSLLVALYPGQAPPPAIRDDLIAFARPPFALALRSPTQPNPPPGENEGAHLEPAVFPLRANDDPPRGLLALGGTDGVHFNWEPKAGAVAYRLYVGAEPGFFGPPLTVRTTGHLAERLRPNRAFEPGRSYYAAVAALDRDGNESQRSEEIDFHAGPVTARGPTVPKGLLIAYIWKYLTAEIFSP